LARMAGSSSMIAMRRDMAANIAEGAGVSTCCPRFVRILRCFARRWPRRDRAWSL